LSSAPADTEKRCAAGVHSDSADLIREDRDRDYDNEWS
jgi:hypothetical protein